MSATPCRSAATTSARTPSTQSVADLAGVSIDWFAPLRRGHETHALSPRAREDARP